MVDMPYNQTKSNQTKKMTQFYSYFTKLLERLRAPEKLYTKWVEFLVDYIEFDLRFI